MNAKTDVNTIEDKGVNSLFAEAPDPDLIKHDLNIDILSASLDPNPSDPLNPQNWSKWKKRSVFFALMTSSILCDGGMTWGASLFVLQSFQWDIPMSLSTTSVNYGILLQGFGGVFAVPFMQTFGRYVIVVFIFEWRVLGEQDLRDNVLINIESLLWIDVRIGIQFGFGHNLSPLVQWLEPLSHQASLHL